MKKKVYILLMLLTNILLFTYINVDAQTIIKARISATYGVKLREENTTNSNAIMTIPYNTIVTLTEYSDSGNGCNDKWIKVLYKLNNASYEGYICSTFTEISEVNEEEQIQTPIEIKETEMSKMTDEEFDTYLNSQGFPEDYKIKLKEIHKIHPNWIFKGIKSKYTWNQALAEQNKPGNSFLNVNTSLKEKGYEGLLSTNSGDYNYETDTFIPHDGIYWYQARSETIAYYMDPRNYLNEKTLFAFEDLLYYPEYQTIDAVNKILLTDFMKQFGNFFIAAAQKYNVSPVYLASLSRQEVGVSNTNIVTNGKAGILSDGVDYTGYYNFFNVGASSSADPKLQSLKRAKKEGWDTEEKSILGGSMFNSVNYIGCGQYTSYFQKFNVSNTATKGIWHQYTTNLDALSSPSISTYNSYQSMGLIEEPFTFAIPIYEGMPITTSLPPLGNPNNYLKDLNVNNNYVTNFDGANTEYTITVPKSDNYIVTGTPVNNHSKIEIDNYTIIDNKATIKINVTAQNGEIRTYTLYLNIYEEIKEEIKDNTETETEIITENPQENESEVKEEKETNTEQETPKIKVDDVISASKYKKTDNYLSGITLGSSVETLINELTTKYKTASINIKDRNNLSKTSGTINTGDKIIIGTGFETETLEIVIYGDINGDGNISAIDLLNIQKSILGYTTLTGPYAKAADVNKDSKISAIDLLNIQKHILKYIVISQD